MRAYKRRGATEIGNDVWVGQNVVVLPGCKKVGNRAVIGAGSIVALTFLRIQSLLEILQKS